MSNESRTFAAIFKGDALGGFEKCRRCGQYDWNNIHECGRVWDVVCLEYGCEDEPDCVYCDGEAREVAEKYVSQNFGNWDFPQVVQVLVREGESELWRKFQVTVEFVPSFEAVECEE